MNELLQKLAEQSTEKIHRFSYSLGHRTETVFDREKFAELIIRECAVMCRWEHEAHIMLAHFGVEE